MLVPALRTDHREVFSVADGQVVAKDRVEGDVVAAFEAELFPGKHTFQDVF